MAGKRPTVVLGALVALFGLATFAPAQHSAFKTNEEAAQYGDVSGQGKPDWIHIVWNGPSLRLPPLIWISRQPLKLIDSSERNIVLSQAEFDRLQGIPVNLPGAPVGIPIFGEGHRTDFRITVRRGYSSPITYNLNVLNGCRYLHRLVKTEGVAWTDDRLYPISYFDRDCDYAEKPKGEPAILGPVTFRSEDIVGSWSDNDGTCKNDSYTTYKRDGTWQGGPFRGTWRLVGRSLVTATSGIAFPGEKEESVNSMQGGTTIVSVSKTQMIERDFNGKDSVRRRCP